MGKIAEIDKIIASNIIAIIGEDYGVQRKLAKAAKINPITLNRILKLKQRAGRGVVLSISKALNVPEDELYQKGPSQEVRDLKVTVDRQNRIIGELMVALEKLKLAEDETKLLDTYRDADEVSRSSIVAFATLDPLDEEVYRQLDARLQRGRELYRAQLAADKASAAAPPEDVKKQPR